MAVPAEIRRNATLVMVAALLYLVLQMVLAGFARPLGPFERALFGGVATEDLWVVRLGTMIVSTLGMAAAFRSWVRPAGKTAWAAAGVFAVSWAPLHYGGELRPETFAALAAVAAGGCTVRWLVERDRGSLVWIAVAVLLTVALLPLVGAVLAVSLAIVVAVWARTGGGLALVAVGAGLVAGRLAGAGLRSLGNGALVASVEQSLRTTAAATRPAFADVLEPAALGGPERAVVGGVVLLALVVVAVVWWRWPHRRNAARTGTALSAALIATLMVAGAASPAAYLPAYALLTIPVGAGLLGAWRSARETGSFVATAAYVVVVVAFVAWQGAVTAAVAGG